MLFTLLLLSGKGQAVKFESSSQFEPKDHGTQVIRAEQTAQSKQ